MRRPGFAPHVPDSNHQVAPSGWLYDRWLFRRHCLCLADGNWSLGPCFARYNQVKHDFQKNKNEENLFIDWIIYFKIAKNRFRYYCWRSVICLRRKHDSCFRWDTDWRRIGIGQSSSTLFQVNKKEQKVERNDEVEKFCGWKNDPFWHLFRGLRHRNLSAIRHATQRGLHQLQQLHGAHGHEHGSQIKSKGAPLMIQGFRSNPKDPESHILFFDIEALIGIKPFSNVVQPKLIFF